MKKRFVVFCMLAAVSLLPACAVKRTGSAGDDPAETITASETESSPAETKKADEAAEDLDAGNEKAAEDEAAAEIKPGLNIEQVFSDKYTEDGRVLIRVSGVRLHPDDETRKAYPELSKALEEWNAGRDLSRKQCFEDFKETAEEYAPSSEELAEYDMYPWLFDKEEAGVLRADRAVVSMVVDTDFNGGGPHGEYIKKGICFDTQTGARVGIFDVVKDMEAFGRILDERLSEEYADVCGGLFQMPSEYIAENSLDQEDFSDWSLGNEYITAHFNPYSLGAYALGRQDITIYFDEAPELFHEKYLQVAGDYVEAFSGGRYDADGDGKRENIAVEYIYPEGDVYYMDGLRVSDGSRSVQLDGMFFSTKEYLVRSGGRYYMYVMENCENDWTAFVCVDLADVKCVCDGQNLEPAYLGWNDTEDGYGYTEAVLTDPDDMRLSSRMQIFGTCNAYRAYAAGADGVPQSDGVYSYVNANIVRAEMDVPCADGVIPAGTYLRAVATDNETWVDLQAVDAGIVEDTGWNEYVLKDGEEMPDAADSGKVFRVYLDYDGAVPQVQGSGENITNVFSGIIYAG